LPTFVSLINWTEQGIRSFKDTPKRADAFAEMLQQKGGKLRDIYWTLGAYDIVAIAEAPDAETMTAALLQVAALGNVRTTTLQAFDKDALAKIISKAG
jgi:uncharacterized protein with GYD domain